jgi:hypothetical protein
MKNFVLFRILPIPEYEDQGENSGWNAFYDSYSTLAEAVAIGVSQVYDAHKWYDFQIVDLEQAIIIMDLGRSISADSYKALKDMLKGNLAKGEWARCVLDGTIALENMQVVFKNIQPDEVDIVWLKAAKEYNLRTLTKKVLEYRKYSS